jgi:hypothetical protein
MVSLYLIYINMNLNKLVKNINIIINKLVKNII